MVALAKGPARHARTAALRLVIGDFLDRGALVAGVQSRLAARWGVTRQRVSRLVADERKVTGEARWRPLGNAKGGGRNVRTG